MLSFTSKGLAYYIINHLIMRRKKKNKKHFKTFITS